MGAQCDTCRENYYQPDPNEGCLPCNCNLGGSVSAQCDMVAGQCDCLPGITGTQCSETIPGHFFPTIDHLRLEGEAANSIPPSLLSLSSGEGDLFTGTGYYRVVEGEGISNFGTLFFPVSGTYDVLFRYNLVGSLVWSTVTLTIRAGSEDGTGAADCGSGSELPIGDTSIQYTSWSMGTGLAISRNICFRAGRSYTFILSEPNSGQTGSPTLDIDSLVAIPIDIPSLAVFGESQVVSDYNSCVDSWRRVPTISSAEPICERVTFTFSTAIYGGALGKLLAFYNLFFTLTSNALFQSVIVILMAQWLDRIVRHLEVSVCAYLVCVDEDVMNAALEPLTSLPLDAQVRLYKLCAYISPFTVFCIPL